MLVLAVVALEMFVVPAWHARFIAVLSWDHWPFLLFLFALMFFVGSIVRGTAKASQYLPVLVVCLTIPVLVIGLMPSLSGHLRTAEAAFFFGALVAISEIASRYRDEPIQACLSPYGIIYIVLNGTISLAALVLIFHFNASFKAVASDSVLAALTAGFGSSAVMRTRLAVLKGEDNKDISIGPDYVIKILLGTVDKYVDRFRAARRQALVVSHINEMRRLGPFLDAANYLSNALLAFQNIDESLKKQLSDTLDGYDRKKLPADIKFLAMGFLFLNLVGESHFADVLEQAAKLITAAATANPVPPDGSNPVAPAAPILAPPVGGNAPAGKSE